MNKIILLMTIVASTCAMAAFEAIQIPTGGQTIYAPGKVARIEVVSSVAAGKATVKRVSPVMRVTDVIETYATTNTTYTTVYSNSLAQVITNVSPYITRKFDANLISYTTNNVVTSYAITNAVPKASTFVTNNVADEITCSGGIGGASPNDKWILPGEKLIYSGTATGVTVILER